MVAPEGFLMTRLMRIGEFARRTGLPIRTLRFYDAVDGGTGYRLYAHQQLEHARRVIALRRFGLQLEEIRHALTGEDAEREVLLAARARIERSIVRQSSQLAE